MPATIIDRHSTRTPLAGSPYSVMPTTMLPAAPIPDLLSTATALQALSGMKISIAGIQEACLDFVDSLWTNRGAFYGNWMDDTVDCEYTYYGLLALGHLSL